MARANVVHSQDAVTVIFEGHKSKPEPATAVIKFPGGHVEVSRTSQGDYWAHVMVNGNIVASRINYHSTAGHAIGVPDLPEHEHIRGLAVMVGI